MNCPGRAGGRGSPSGEARTREKMLLLSGSMRATFRGRNPGQAGGGLVAAPVRPRLPVVGPSTLSSRSCSEVFHPGLSAGMRSPRSSCAREWPGR